MDTTNVENHVEFLWNASSLLKSQTHAQKLLKSYYLLVFLISTFDDEN